MTGMVNKQVWSGYRKTLVQRAPRIPSHLMPQWRLSFVVPALHELGFNRKRYGHMIGVVIDQDGGVVVWGRNRQWVEDQAERLVRQVAPYGFARPVAAVPERDADPTAEHGGGKISRAGAIEWDGRDVRLVTGHAMGKL